MGDEKRTKTGRELELELGLGGEEPERPTVSPPFDVASFARTSAGGEAEDAAPESERPTVAPPFDVAAFAKESDEASQILRGKRGAAATLAVPPVLDLRQRLARGDYAGALAVAEAMLATEPGSIEATACAEVCRANLLAKYAEQLGPLDGVPEVVVGHDQLRALHIDHRSGFLLSLVDGISSFDLILDICGMARADAMRILAELVQERIVSIPRK